MHLYLKREKASSSFLYPSWTEPFSNWRLGEQAFRYYLLKDCPEGSIWEYGLSRTVPRNAVYCLCGFCSPPRWPLSKERLSVTSEMLSKGESRKWTAWLLLLLFFVWFLCFLWFFLFCFFRKEREQTDNVNTVPYKITMVPLHWIFFVLLSLISDVKKVKVHKEGRNKEDQGYRRSTQKIS